MVDKILEIFIPTHLFTKWTKLDLCRPAPQKIDFLIWKNCKIDNMHSPTKNWDQDWDHQNELSKKYDICLYHYKFKENAKKYIKLCAFKNSFFPVQFEKTDELYLISERKHHSLKTIFVYLNLTVLSQVMALSKPQEFSWDHEKSIQRMQKKIHISWCTSWCKIYTVCNKMC